MAKVEHRRINRTVVSITEDELLKNLKSTYADIILDTDREDLASVVNGFLNDCREVEQQRYVKLFRDGMTMMLLGDTLGTTVDKFFIEKKKPKHYDTGDMEILVVIDCGDHMQTIYEQDLQY